MRTAEGNAVEFGQLTGRGSVRILRCWPPAHAGRVTGAPATASCRWPLLPRRRRCDPSTVTEHLKKWDRMASAGWDINRDQLSPDRC